MPDKNIAKLPNAQVHRVDRATAWVILVLGVGTVAGVVVAMFPWAAGAIGAGAAVIGAGAAILAVALPSERRKRIFRRV